MSWLVRQQLQFHLQLAFRVSPELLLGAYLDAGLGAAGRVAVDCPIDGNWCAAASAHAGLMGRYAFTPTGRGTPWVSAGAGWEYTSVGTGTPTPRLGLSGPELRLGAGYDFRNDGRIGFGPFLDGTVCRYSQVSGSGGATSPSGRPVHVWVTAGVRLLLFP